MRPTPEPDSSRTGSMSTSRRNQVRLERAAARRLVWSGGAFEGRKFPADAADQGRAPACCARPPRGISPSPAMIGVFRARPFHGSAPGGVSGRPNRPIPGTGSTEAVAIAPVAAQRAGSLKNRAPPPFCHRCQQWRLHGGAAHLNSGHDASLTYLPLLGVSSLMNWPRLRARPFFCAVGGREATADWMAACRGRFRRAGEQGLAAGRSGGSAVQAAQLEPQETTKCFDTDLRRCPFVWR